MLLQQHHIYCGVIGILYRRKKYHKVSFDEATDTLEVHVTGDLSLGVMVRIVIVLYVFVWGSDNDASANRVGEQVITV